MYIGEFECLVCLGKGTYGAVYLVRSRITGALMALKRVAKEHIVNYQGLMTQFR
jgi:serine/threonine protein kinase